MWGLTIAFLLGLLRLISCQYFEELLKDVCFQKIYKCGDHRPRVTGNSERFETDPYQFGEMCRKHKEYIACVDDAVSNNCNESISDLALMTWSNRISLKMFCRNLEWWNNYFSSVSCINENKDKIQRDCDYEESIHVDDRPWWCLIQEPCEVIQRIFNCTVQKMKVLCGATAAEVFRRIQILNADNLDVVCEFRRQNTRYCRYKRQKRHIDAVSQDRVASSNGLHKKSETETMYNVLEAVLIDTVKNLEEQQQQAFSRIIDSDNVKLRKLFSVVEESPNQVEKGSKLFKRFGFQEDDPGLKYPEISLRYSATESTTPSTEFNSESNKNINSESDSDSQELEYSFVKFLKERSRLREIDDAISRFRTRTLTKKPRKPTKLIPDHLVGHNSDIAEMNHLRRLTENELLHFRKNSKALTDLHLRLKNHLFRVVDMLTHGDIIVGSLAEHFVEFYWTNLEIPIQSIVCGMINISSKNVFKCSMKWDYSENELNATINSNWENQNSATVSNDHLSDIHRFGYVIKDKDYQYKDNSYPGVELERKSRVRKRVRKIEKGIYDNLLDGLNKATRYRKKREIEAVRKEIHLIRRNLVKMEEEYKAQERQRRKEKIEWLVKKKEEILARKRARTVIEIHLKHKEL